MSQPNKNHIELYCGEDLILTLDPDSPDLNKIVEKIILNNAIDTSKIICKTNIDEFDKEGFLVVIVESINSIKQKIKINNTDYELTMKSLVKDLEVEDFYQFLIKNDKNTIIT